MLQLFHSIFGTNRTDTPYPDELIKRAIERAVDGTDPRLRVLPGYQKKLRAAVVKAIDHVVTLVDELPPPLVMERARFFADPELIAFFASVFHAQEVLTHDAELDRYLGTHPSEQDPVYMLLLMEQHERQVFGVALEDDNLHRDVAQTTVSFAEHRLLDPTAAEEDTRRLLKRRAFDHLLTLALARIVTAHAERTELEHERHLLHRKNRLLAAGKWGFDAAKDETPPNPRELQQQLDEIERQLKALGSGPGLLQANLDHVVAILAEAPAHFWSEHDTLLVDRMGIKQSKASTTAPPVELTVLRNATGRRLVARLVCITRDDLLVVAK